MGKEVKLISGLSKNKLDELVKLLKQARISAYYKEEGYGNMNKIKSNSDSANSHSIFIDEKDSDKALTVLKNFKQLQEIRVKKKEKSCPNCGAKNKDIIIKRLNFLQRLYYFGTKPRKCKKCNEEWF